MITIQVKNIEGKTTLPIAASEFAAGYDIVAVDDPIIVGESIMKEEEFFPFYKRIDYMEYHTALYISPQSLEQNSKEHYHTLLHPRSSVRKYNLLLANSIGLIDNDYRGEIIMCYKYIWQPEDLEFEMRFLSIKENENVGRYQPTGKLLGKINREKIYKKGDKIGQLVTDKTNPTKYVLVSELDVTARGEGGFGSTDIEKETKNGIGSPLVERYQKSGGVVVREKYSDEIKKRETPQ